MDAPVLLGCFGIYDVWGLCGVSENLFIFIPYGFLGFDDGI